MSISKNPLLLTIGIPTYNRPRLLARQLGLLVEQVASQGAEVEILVCDNASPQDVASVVEGFRTRLRHISYHRNATNVGLFGNVFQTYERARGRYVWFMSDDDEVQPGAVAAVLSLLRQEEPTVLTLGSVTGQTTSGIHADFFGWSDRGAVAALGSTVFISALVLRKYELDTIALARARPNVFPQVTIAVRLLRIRYHLAQRAHAVVRRNVGLVSHNFFQLYCLDLQEAIRQAQWPQIESCLLNHFGEENLRQFVKLQFLERVGLYRSKCGLPWLTWCSGWRDLGRDSSARARLLAILALSLVPSTLARGICWLILAWRYKSWSRASATLREWLALNAQSHSSDI